MNNPDPDGRSITSLEPYDSLTLRLVGKRARVAGKFNPGQSQEKRILDHHLQVPLPLIFALEMERFRSLSTSGTYAKTDAGSNILCKTIFFGNFSCSAISTKLLKSDD